MRFLLDTHTFLWYVTGDTRLSMAARTWIDAPDHDRLVSLVSLWEIAIKHSLGKLELAEPFDLLIPELLAANRMGVLNIQLRHLLAVSRVPYPNNQHKDPFDRLLVAQCLVEKMPLISRDAALDAYGIQRMW